MSESKINKKVVNVIRHLAFEDLGSFAGVLQERGYRLNYIEAPCEDLRQLDPLADDLLIILGGPISVNDNADFAFIDDEISLLKQRLAEDKPTLGICLGAQLIAVALGAPVYSGNEKEIGWYPLKISMRDDGSALQVLAEEHCNMLHWHGETFDLPEGVTLLASSEKFKHQAFSFGENVLALQFHPEVTRESLEKWFVGHVAEITQTPELNVHDLRADTAIYAAQLEKQGRLFLSQWLDELML